MTVYTVKSTKTTVFALSRNETFLGSLTYENWFSSASTIELTNYATFAIQPKGFWGVTVEVKQGENVLFDFEMKWTGQIVINNHADGSASPFIVKQKSIIKNTLVLLNSDGDELLLIEPDFTWRKLTYDYQLTASDTFEQLPSKELLLLVAVHCTNYYFNYVTAMVASTAVMTS